MSVTTIDAAARKHSAPKSSNKIQGGLLDPKMLGKSLPSALAKHAAQRDLRRID